MTHHSLLACLFAGVTAFVAPLPTPGEVAVRPLPAKVVAVWEEAGAEVGWLSTDANLLLGFDRSEVAGAAPGFQLEQWKPGALAALPDPGVPFRLRLCSSEASDADLKDLGKFKSLTHLDLFNTKVTDDGLKRLMGLKRLRELDLAGNSVTDAGLRHLAGLTELADLGLASTSVGDEGLKLLANHRKLTRLSLIATLVTDEGLKTLYASKHLLRLELYDAKITDEGLEALRTRLPGCQITPAP